MRRKIKTKHQHCLICKDECSGKHYGVVSCEGCKSFFKRCVRKGSSFVCQDGGSCEINKDRRTKCPSCRLKRCMEVGMKPDAVQNGTAEISTNNTIGYSQGHVIINRLLEFEDILNFEPTTNITSFHSSEVQHLHILRSVVRWCCKMTSFAGLPSYDARILIGCTWHHVFAVSLIHSNHQSIRTESHLQTSSNKCLFIFLERLKSVCSSRIETMYLRSLLLLNPDVQLLANPSQVEQFQNKLLKLVSEEPSSYTGVPVTCSINKLLLVLLGTNSCKPQVLEKFFFPSVRPSIQTQISEMTNNLLIS